MPLIEKWNWKIKQQVGMMKINVNSYELKITQTLEKFA